MQLAIRLLLEAATSKERASKTSTAVIAEQVVRLQKEAAELRAAATVLLEYSPDDYR
jgi:hypothetical protein